MLLAAATLLFGWTIVEYRRPKPRLWTRAETSAIAVMCTTMSLLTFGVGYLIRFLVPLSELRLDIEGAAAIGAVFIALWVGILGLRARGRRLAISDRAAGGAPFSIVKFPSESPPPSPDRSIGPFHPVGGGRRARRRKAA